MDIFYLLGNPVAKDLRVELQRGGKGGKGGQGKARMPVRLHIAPAAASERNYTYVAIATVLWLMGRPTTQWGIPPNLWHFAKTGGKFLRMPGVGLVTQELLNYVPLAGPPLFFMRCRWQELLWHLCQESASPLSFFEWQHVAPCIVPLGGCP